MAWWLFTSRRWTAPLPINVYVIEHSEGLVLFDTGQDRRSVTDSNYFPRGLAGVIYARLARFVIGPHETLSELLSAQGYSISDVRIAVLSHLHQDHIGGLPELGHAEILVSAAEWALLERPLPEFAGLLSRHIRLVGLRWKRVEFEPTTDVALVPFTESFDLFGDGICVLLPTPGHTAGSLSLLVRQKGIPPMLFVGDLTYDATTLGSGRVPGVGKRRQLLKSSAAVAQLRDAHPGLLVLAAHDRAAAGMLENANR